MHVREAMHPGVEWMAPTASLSELAQVMRDNDIGAIPIGENDRLVGMVTDRDMVVKGRRREEARCSTTPAAACRSAMRGIGTPRLTPNFPRMQSEECRIGTICYHHRCSSMVKRRGKVSLPRASHAGLFFASRGRSS